MSWQTLHNLIQQMYGVCIQNYKDPLLRAATHISQFEIQKYLTIDFSFFDFNFIIIIISCNLTDGSDKRIMLLLLLLLLLLLYCYTLIVGYYQNITDGTAKVVSYILVLTLIVAVQQWLLFDFIIKGVCLPIINQ